MLLQDDVVVVVFVADIVLVVAAVTENSTLLFHGMLLDRIYNGINDAFNSSRNWERCPRNIDQGEN